MVIPVMPIHPSSPTPVPREILVASNEVDPPPFLCRACAAMSAPQSSFAAVLQGLDLFLLGTLLRHHTSLYPGIAFSPVAVWRIEILEHFNPVILHLVITLHLP